MNATTQASASITFPMQFSKTSFITRTCLPTSWTSLSAMPLLPLLPTRLSSLPVGHALARGPLRRHHRRHRYPRRPLAAHRNRQLVAQLIPREADETELRQPSLLFNRLPVILALAPRLNAIRAPIAVRDVGAIVVLVSRSVGVLGSVIFFNLLSSFSDRTRSPISSAFIAPSSSLSCASLSSLSLSLSLSVSLF